MAVSVLVLLPSITEGIENYSGGTCLDGWSYVTVGQSLQRHALGSEGWLPIDVQYSASFGKNSRFISPSFLALLAPLSGEANDTQTVLGPYIGWLFFAFGAACLFLAKCLNLKRWLGVSFVSAAVLSGWTLKVVNANNVDNALALSFLPAIIGLVLTIERPSKGQGLVLGLIAAANLYAYPESFLFTAAALFLVLVERLLNFRDRVRDWGRLLLLIGLTACVCLVPYLLSLSSHLRRETAMTQQTGAIRPGEPFYHLLADPKYYLPGFWGLTPDFDKQAPPGTYVSHYDSWAFVCSLGLTALMVTGMVVMVRGRKWGLSIFAIGMTVAYFFSLTYLRYPYLAYKIANLEWVAMIVIVFAGVQYVIELSRQSHWERIAPLGGLATIGFGLTAFFVQEKMFYDSLPFKSVQKFSEIARLENLARGQPVALFVDELYANIWATHYLRDCRLYLDGEYRGYMSGWRSYMDRSEPVKIPELRYVVTDSRKSLDQGLLLSKLGPYFVWDSGGGPWALIREIENANGLEGIGTEKPFFWLGKGDTQVNVFANRNSEGLLAADIALGPSLPGKKRQKLLVAEEGYEQEYDLENGPHQFHVQLHTGDNRVILRPLESPTSFLANDPRPLLMQVTNLRAFASADEVEIRSVDTPNGVEHWGGEGGLSLWMGGGDTTVSILSSRAGLVRLKASLVAGPSLADQSHARILLIDPEGTRLEEDIHWGEADLYIRVRSGLNKIVLRTSGPVNLAANPPGDGRVMLVGLRNPVLSYADCHGNPESNASNPQTEHRDGNKDARCYQ